jgi:type IV pilus assembly protein PilC
MLTYTYVARDSHSGEKIAADIQADNEQSAAKLLIERGLAPLEIEVKKERSSIGGLANRVPTKHRVLFSRQLSTLINAGLPLVQSLRSVRDQTRNKTLQEVVDKAIVDIESGSTFAAALAKYPRIFNDVYTSLIAAGEASGTLDTSLERLANQQEKDAELISKVRGAMAYPVIVLFVLGLVVSFMLTIVLPQVEELYKTLPGVKLPLPTRVLLAISNVLIHQWLIILIALVILAAFTTRWARSLGGKQVIDEFKLKAWPLKLLFTKLYMARFARTGATLVASGVPMIKMLNTTSEAVGNVHIANSINKATEQVKGGKALSDSLRGSSNFLPLVPDMIHIGEQSGQLEGMLGKVADYYEKEVDNEIKNISTLIEPVLMIVVGVMALVIVAAVLLPIYGLAGKDFLHSK